MFVDGMEEAVWVFNVLVMTAVPLLLSALFIRLPGAWFEREEWGISRETARRKRFVYERILFIRWWKERLPDGGAWMKGGFSKKKLESKELAYYRLFIVETRRGECAHWLMLLFTPVYGLWNNSVNMLILIGAALLINLPCIAVQRYNRMRLQQFLSRRAGAAQVSTRMGMEKELD